MATSSLTKIRNCVLLTVLFSKWSSAAPATRRGYIVLPIRNGLPGTEIGPELRQGPIASWIQNSQIFPIEVNVPDLISNLGSGVQNFGQGIQNFGQNIGQGYQSVISNLAQRFPIINRIPILNNNQNRPQRYMILIPVEQDDSANKIDPKPSAVRIPDYTDFFTYP